MATRTEEIEAIKFRMTSGPRIASQDILQLLKDQAAEIDRLRVALGEYGDHHGHCPARIKANVKCKCGFSDSFRNGEKP